MQTLIQSFDSLSLHKASPNEMDFTSEIKWNAHPTESGEEEEDLDNISTKENSNESLKEDDDEAPTTS